MKITVLGSGTSQGVPVIGCNCSVCRSLDFRDKRLRVSLHISVDDQSFIIDSGPDFRQQVLRERIRHVDALIFTHEHKDHTAGMDDIRSFNFLQKQDIPIYGRASVLNQIKQEFSYIFSENAYPGVPRVTPMVIENKPFKIQRVEVIPIEALHYKLPVFGFRIKDFTYLTDIKTIGPKEIAKAKGSKVLVLDALQKEDHISHLTLSEALELATEIGAEKTYFTHISHKMGLHESVEKELPDNISLAYDGLQIDL
ncbi:MBL fold metallo-hydrolase [Roseivirga misakiensis]|uniref:MBL fold metallo-hydrolase n=1 Tax=Roseivirga misakiensis TaxID=1563681 RepID=A0A1E5SLG1_9BACT|nr:MBL fold metallo-hydrolase [Roseivirga misakiensis]OEJ99965.1 MBL fold metallo-hydrolase [Roseivirga misakiensis]